MSGIKRVAMAFDCAVLEGAHRQVLSVICDHSDEKGFAHPGHALIAWRCDISEKTSQRIVKLLSALGVLRMSQGQGRQANSYWVNLLWMTRIQRRFDDLKQEAIDAGRDPWPEMVSLCQRLRDQLYTDGVPVEDIPYSWSFRPRADEIARLRGKKTTASPVKGQRPRRASACGDTESPQDQPHDVDKSGPEDVENVEPEKSCGDKSDACGDKFRSCGDTCESAEPFNPITHTARARTASPDDVENGPGVGAAESGPDPGSSAGWKPPDRPREVRQEPGTGALDRQARLARQIATVYWAACGVWSPPSGFTLDLGPPPCADGYALDKVAVKLVLDDELAPALRHGRSTGHGPIRAMGTIVRKCLSGQVPEVSPEDVRTRIRQLQQWLDRPAPSRDDDGENWDRAMTA